MAGWGDILNEIQGKLNEGHSSLDKVRRKYIEACHKASGRNVIAYYSGWLEKPVDGIAVCDVDMQGFQNATYGLNPSKGLDLILHTPGGDPFAAECIMNYLVEFFSKDIRVIVPQLAMSAGTLMACASKKILMGRYSSLGPIDPQFSSIPAQGVIEEFDEALRQVQSNPGTIPIWQIVVSKYEKAFVGQCKKAIAYTQNLAEQWLYNVMFSEENEEIAKKIAKQLIDFGTSSAHVRHLSKEKCSNMGLNIQDLESDEKLEKAVLAMHHAYSHTFTMSPAIKIIENHESKAYIRRMPNQNRD